MDLPRPIDRYSRPAQLAHWLTVALLVALFALGFTMEDMAASPLRVKLFAWHKWIGVSLFLLVALRLAFRLAVRPPPLPARMKPWEQRAAEITHRLLYGLLLAVPLAGWLMSSAKGFQTVWFGVLPLPDLLAKNPPLGAALESVHWATNKLLLGAIALHVAAALKHHFHDRDEVLARMVPGLRARARPEIP